MIEKLLSIFKKESVRYIIIGVCTTAVNFIGFACFYNLLDLGLNLSNFISISLSIIFAFFANKTVVFSSAFESITRTFAEFLGFVGGRILTMVIEIFGVWLLVTVIEFNEYASKLLIQVIVLILNYIISKYFVFRRSERQ